MTGAARKEAVCLGNGAFYQIICLGWASQMSQQVKELATKPNNPSSIPGIHMMEGHN